MIFCSIGEYFFWSEEGGGHILGNIFSIYPFCRKTHFGGGNYSLSTSGAPPSSDTYDQKKIFPKRAENHKIFFSTFLMRIYTLNY